MDLDWSVTGLFTMLVLVILVLLLTEFLRTVLSCKYWGPVINYRGGGGLVQKRGGSDIFVHERRGGAKIFVQYKYIPARLDPAVP